VTFYKQLQITLILYTPLASLSIVVVDTTVITYFLRNKKVKTYSLRTGVAHNMLTVYRFDTIP
jgi:hypothetical protein